MLETYKSSHFISHDPHAFLGRHPLDDDHDVIVAYRPGFLDCYLQLDGKMVLMEKGEGEGVFFEKIPKSSQSILLYHKSGLLAHDPYSFTAQISDVDQYLFAKGVHYKLYDILGAHKKVIHGIEGVYFSVWAPSCVKVCLMGDFNHFCTKTNPMRALGSSGIWELFVPGLKAFEKYKFCLTTPFGQELIKTDPMGQGFEHRPQTAAVVTESSFKFTDAAYMEKRSEVNFYQSPFNCYELHLGSWKKGLGFKEAALELAPYAKSMGFTHIQLLPVMEHPLDESWGYQVTGFFAPSSRWGTIDDFKFFINHMHENGLGVILDWVPAHFPTDDFALAKFDGTALYEHTDEKKGLHPHWNTLIFNYSRHEVQNFLLASALYWLEEFHVDGLRVDAVASMLYLDYGRSEGEWIPNQFGGKENLEAVDFLKHLNSIVQRRVKGALMIAEESTSFTGVTHSVDYAGLGFHFKWNMGWMNDTLRYFHQDPFFRKYHHHLLTFGLLYAFSENFQYVLSHDEVVHGKGSLLSKMPGDLWQKFANLRLLIAYMITQPGKKLLFMGGEIGDYEEWNMYRSVSWHLLSHPESKGLKELVATLNHLYKNKKPLYEWDHDPRGFQWVSMDDTHNSVISYLRKSEHETLLVVLNFTPQVLNFYDLYLPYGEGVTMILNTDAKEFCGSHCVIETHLEKIDHGSTRKLTLTLPPLGCLIFEVHV